jgi:hypothetical protein
VRHDPPSCPGSRLWFDYVGCMMPGRRPRRHPHGAIAFPQGGRWSLIVTAAAGRPISPLGRPAVAILRSSAGRPGPPPPSRAGPGREPSAPAAGRATDSADATTLRSRSAGRGRNRRPCPCRDRPCGPYRDPSRGPCTVGGPCRSPWRDRVGRRHRPDTVGAPSGAWASWWAWAWAPGSALGWAWPWASRWAGLSAGPWAGPSA